MVDGVNTEQTPLSVIHVPAKVDGDGTRPAPEQPALQVAVYVVASALVTVPVSTDAAIVMELVVLVTTPLSVHASVTLCGPAAASANDQVCVHAAPAWFEYDAVLTPVAVTDIHPGCTFLV